MADQRLTDKTELAQSAGGDFLHIVDISDTSSNPAGTSKKIQVDNLVNQSKNRIRVVSTNYTLTSEDQVIIVDTAAIVITLPISTTFIDGNFAKRLTIKNISDGVITVNTTASERIDNLQSLDLPPSLSSVDLTPTTISNFEFIIN